MLYPPAEEAANRAIIDATGKIAAGRGITPRHDFQGISDEAELQRIRDRIPGYANA